MKNVLLIETLSQVNGGQKMSLLISEMLEDSGDYKVIWAIPEEGILSEKLKGNGNKYHLLGNIDMPAGVKGKSVIFKYGWMSVKVIAKLLNLIRKEKINIIYAPGPAALPWSAICGTLTHRPVIWHLHHMFLDGMTIKLLNLCSGFGSVKVIIAVSNVVGEQIIKENGRQKVRVFYNPVDFEMYQKGNVENIKNIYPFNQKLVGDIQILEHIGLIHPTKRQDFTIKLIGTFKQMGIPMHAIYIGTCQEQDQAYMDELVDLSKAVGVIDRVHFVGQQSNVQDWLTCADAVIIPSIEGMPLVALESMAAGVPVVATEECGAGELIRASKAGIIFRNDSSLENICNNVINMIKDNNCGAIGKQFALKQDENKYKVYILNKFDTLHT